MQLSAEVAVYGKLLYMYWVNL